MKLFLKPHLGGVDEITTDYDMVPGTAVLDDIASYPDLNDALFAYGNNAAAEGEVYLEHTQIPTALPLKVNSVTVHSRIARSGAASDSAVGIAYNGIIIAQSPYVLPSVLNVFQEIQYSWLAHPYEGFPWDIDYVNGSYFGFSLDTANAANDWGEASRLYIEVDATPEAEILSNVTSLKPNLYVGESFILSATTEIPCIYQSTAPLFAYRKPDGTTGTITAFCYDTNSLMAIVPASLLTVAGKYLFKSVYTNRIPGMPTVTTIEDKEFFVNVKDRWSL